MLYINFTSGYPVDMTLAFRNKTIIAYITLSLCVFSVLVFFVIYGYTQGVFQHPSDSMRFIPFFAYSTPAVLASICTLVLFGAGAGFVIFFMFEKTQASEIIYFGLFLITCMMESLRFVIFYFNSAGIYVAFMLLAARCIFFARICAALSFLSAAIFCGGKIEQDPERSFYLIFAAAILCAGLIPFNTGYIASNGMITYGYLQRIFFIRILFAVITFFSFLIQGSIRERPEYKGVAWGFVLLYAGYLLLTMTDSLFLYFTGTALLTLGTKFFLNNLHRYYLWK